MILFIVLHALCVNLTKQVRVRLMQGSAHFPGYMKQINYRMLWQTLIENRTKYNIDNWQIHV